MKYKNIKRANEITEEIDWLKENILTRERSPQRIVISGDGEYPDVSIGIRYVGGDELCLDFIKKVHLMLKEKISELKSELDRL